MQAGSVCELALGEKAVDPEPSEDLGERHDVSPPLYTLTICYQKEIKIL